MSKEKETNTEVCKPRTETATASIDPSYVNLSTKAAMLYQKINKVMAAVEYLNKDDTVAFLSTRYKAISEEKVTTVLRAAMIREGLVIFPVTQIIGSREMIVDGRRTGYFTEVNVNYKLADMKTGYYEIVTSSGQGVDSQDKGSGKAMTYAFKYALLRTFMIPTGDDPDKITSDELDDKEKKLIEKLEKAATKTKIAEVLDKVYSTPSKTETTSAKELPTDQEIETHMEETFPGTTVLAGGPNQIVTVADGIDPEIEALVKKAFPGAQLTAGRRLVKAFKGEPNQLITMLKSRIKE